MLQKHQIVIFNICIGIDFMKKTEHFIRQDFNTFHPFEILINLNWYIKECF